MDSLRKSAIDLLLYDAGIFNPSPSLLVDIDYTAWVNFIHINVMSPRKICAAFSDYVAASNLKKIAIMSSKKGSIDDNSLGGSYVYRSTKAALNAVMKSLSTDLAPRSISVAILHPGWVRIAMGGSNGLIDAPESVNRLLKVI